MEKCSWGILFHRDAYVLVGFYSNYSFNTVDKIKQVQRKEIIMQNLES